MRKSELALGLGLGLVACSSNNSSPPVTTTTPSVAIVNNLVSDDNTVVPALNTDPKLVNSWGLAAGPGTFWWVANNGTGTATLYDASGNKQALEVSVPGSPTGMVFNGGSGFPVNGSPATFIMASEDGTISAWNAASGTQASVVVDDSASGAVFKGLALTGDQLYATDFHNNSVDVFDSTLAPVPLAAGAFTDPSLPAGFAPFGIAAVNGNLIVTYAMQDSDAHDDVKGPGNGFVDQYDATGTLMQRIATQGDLNSPWGIVMAPSTFNGFPGQLLIGNFGDGHITAFDTSSCSTTCTNSGQLKVAGGSPVVIDGLWSLAFGQGDANTGPANQLFFTAGPNAEANGLFGSITTTAPGSTQAILLPRR
jgi:uncharacterized protein (TIGR03118 family)